jgi:hypothetical protein
VLALLEGHLPADHVQHFFQFHRRVHHVAVPLVGQPRELGPVELAFAIDQAERPPERGQQHSPSNSTSRGSLPISR